MVGRTSKVIGSALFTIAGAVAVLTASSAGPVSHAYGICPEDMHWLVCETARTGAEVVTDTVPSTVEDMHW
ncbi:hypothetical protein ACTG9Q_12415 [Actinokineospora sp. 24-640]